VFFAERYLRLSDVELMELDLYDYPNNEEFAALFHELNEGSSENYDEAILAIRGETETESYDNALRKTYDLD
jgi:hypothetical protein